MRTEPETMDLESFYRELRRPGFLPGYEIENRLGGGAFGEVYKARKVSIGKPYAVKFLLLQDERDRDVIERELRQVAFFASIDHPNLVTIEDVGTVAGVPYLVMGYAGEETLARRLRRGGLGRREAFSAFVQTCRGVHALHQRRLVHFDLKPSNIFLRGELARVGDYGLARLMADGRRTLSFGRGTPHYMAPEILNRVADHRADLYSLGVILYECIAGRLPFQPVETLGIVVRVDDRPPEMPAAFPQRLREPLSRCLRLAPEDRYESAEALLADLGQSARQGGAIDFTPLEEPPPRPAQSVTVAGRPVAPRGGAAHTRPHFQAVPRPRAPRPAMRRGARAIPAPAAAASLEARAGARVRASSPLTLFMILSGVLSTLLVVRLLVQ
jgi:serine/threonine protein kinase